VFHSNFAERLMRPVFHGHEIVVLFPPDGAVRDVIATHVRVVAHRTFAVIDDQRVGEEAWLQEQTRGAVDAREDLFDHDPRIRRQAHVRPLDAVNGVWKFKRRVASNDTAPPRVDATNEESAGLTTTGATSGPLRRQSRRRRDRRGVPSSPKRFYSSRSAQIADKWIRILFRCWTERRPYDEQTYIDALRRRGSPLAKDFA
jgi:hypothetical protein